jgi:hypothetical protein
MATFTLLAEDDRPATAKLAEALDLHQWSFGRAAIICYTSPLDAAELAAAGPLPVEVRSRSYIARYQFIVTAEEPGAQPT